MQRLKAYWVLYVLLLKGVWGISQPGTQPGQPLNLDRRAWTGIASAHFDIYVPTQSPALGAMAAKIAEESLTQFNKLIDYQTRYRFAIFVFTDPADIAQSDLWKKFSLREPGISRLFPYSGYATWRNTTREFTEDIRTEVARLLFNDFYYGGGLQSGVSNSVFMHTPRWYADGFCSFFGEGWNYQDEMRLGAIRNENLLDYALTGDGEIHDAVRKSIWNYITVTYGKDKLTEIFFMTRLTRSVESGIITVLGISLKTFTDRWREWAITTLSLNREGRVNATDALKRLDIPVKGKIISFAWHPQRHKLAAYVLHQGHHSLIIYDTQTRKLEKTGLSWGGYDPMQDNIGTDAPMAWSPDGKRLTGIFYEKGTPHWFYLEQGRANPVLFPVRPGLEKVISVSFAGNNTDLLISGMRNGQTDIYLGKAGSNQLTPITQDAFDDLYPLLSPDEQYVYFSSNRDSVTETKDISPFSFRLQALSLYRIPLKGNDRTIERISSDRWVNEKPVVFISSFELLTLSDASGVPNLVARNVFLGEARPFTDYGEGIAAVSGNDSSLVCGIMTKGALSLYGGLSPATSANLSPQPTLLRKFFGQLPGMNPTVYIPPPVKVKAKPIPQPVPEEKIDSILAPKPDTAQKAQKVKFYVFDEEDAPAETRTQRKLKKIKENQPAEEEIPELPDADKTQIRPVAGKGALWATDYITTRVTFSSPWYGRNFGLKPALELGVGLSDLKGRHRITASLQPYFFDLRTSDLKAEYTFIPGRTDVGGYFSRSARFMKNETFQQRWNAYTIGGTASYPLSRHTIISGRIFGSYVTRWDLNTLDEPNYDANDLLPGAGIKFSMDRAKGDQDFRFGGFTWDAWSDMTASVANKQLNFVSLRTDFRKYQRILGNMVLAVRLQAGMSAGPHRQEFFLGGVENAMLSFIQNGQNLPLQSSSLSDFRFLEYVSPIRGFRFNARNGTQYVTASAEVRVPVSRMMLTSLNSAPMYTFELIPFFDIGTIWRQGNPLSQRNPINNEPIVSYPLTINVQTLRSPFIYGFGAGMRTLLMGYSIRADLAWGIEDYTLQKPRLHLTLGKNF